MSSQMALILDSRSEAYHDVKGILHAVVQKFCSRHGEEFDEMLCIANLAFAESWKCFDPTKARFTTHVYFRVYHALLEACRRSKRRAEVFQFAEVEADTLPTARDESFMVDLFDELSSDAQAVVKLVLHGRETSHVLLNSPPCNNTAGNIRNAIATVLHDIGWSTSRITESFTEIGHALSR